jgi:type IV secretion system protein VirD4
MTPDPDRHRLEPVQRPVPPRLPEDGLLVGWSLEHEHRPQVVGFAPTTPPPPAQPPVLEPILATGEGHLLTVAPTGAGKGVGCIIPALLRHRGPVVVVDPKGEAYAVTARRRRELGDQVVLLDPFHVTEGGNKGGLNPLDLIDPESPLALDDAQMLAQMIASYTSTKDPFWDERARQLIAALILHVVSDFPPVLRNLGEVHFLLNQSQSEIDALAKQMARSTRPDVRTRAAILSTAEPRVRASIVSTAQAHAEIVGSPPLKAVLQQTSFALEDIVRGSPLAIYIVLPPDKLETHGKLLRLWLGVVFACLCRRRRAPSQPTLLVLDEAAQLGELPQLRQAVTLLRGYGVRTWSFWQDLSQIERLYPSDWRTIVNNCRVVQAFGMANLAAAETVRALCGYRSAFEILDMDADELLLLAAGDEAVIAQRPNYLNDPPFVGMFDPNLFHEPADMVDILPRRPQRTYRRGAGSRDQSVEGTQTDLPDDTLLGTGAMLTLRQVAEHHRAGRTAAASAARTRFAREIAKLPASQFAAVAEDMGRVLLDSIERRDFTQVHAAAMGLVTLWPRVDEIPRALGEAGLTPWLAVLRRTGLSDLPEVTRAELLSHLVPDIAETLADALGWQRDASGAPPSRDANDVAITDAVDSTVADLDAALSLPGRYRATGAEAEATAAGKVLAQTLRELQPPQVAPVLRAIARKLRASLSVGDRHDSWSCALAMLALWQRPADIVMDDGSRPGIWGWRQVIDESGLRWTDTETMRQLMTDLGPRQAAALRAALGSENSTQGPQTDGQTATEVI